MITTEQTAWRHVWPSEPRRVLAGTTAMYEASATRRRAKLRELRRNVLWLSASLAFFVLAMVWATYPA